MPPAARAGFGAQADAAWRYAELLAGPGVERGLVGPQEVPRLWERHLLNCLAVAPLIDHGSSVCDLGAGSGLPGVVLALARPDLHVVLLEPMLRRVTFLREVAAALPLPNVAVCRKRAEEMVGRLTVDVVTARAVAPLDRLAAWALPLLAPGGTLLALKGRAAETELRVAQDTLRRLGAASWQVMQVGDGLVQPLTTVVRVRMGAHPRRRDGSVPSRNGKR
jgi:16S rRNA (guanine527-N7)-methyltransferase